jgi:hypothetical protein
MKHWLHPSCIYIRLFNSAESTWCFCNRLFLDWNFELPGCENVDCGFLGCENVDNDLPACSIVPQPTTLPRAPVLSIASHFVDWAVGLSIRCMSKLETFLFKLHYHSAENMERCDWRNWWYESDHGQYAYAIEIAFISVGCEHFTTDMRWTILCACTLVLIRGSSLYACQCNRQGGKIRKYAVAIMNVLLWCNGTKAFVRDR